MDIEAYTELLKYRKTDPRDVAYCLAVFTCEDMESTDRRFNKHEELKYYINGNNIYGDIYSTMLHPKPI